MKALSITNIAPHYRKDLWKNLALELNFEFWFGKSNDGITEINFEEYSEIPFKRIRNFYFKNVLIWQFGVVADFFRQRKAISCLVVLGEAYCISNWVLLLLSKAYRVPTCIWTHGLYGNEPGWKKFLRLRFYKLASHVLTYEKRARRLLIESGFAQHRVSVIYNSLHYSLQLQLRNTQMADKQRQFPFFKNPELKCLVFIGRLSTVKKLELLVEAFKQLPAEYNLLMIGDGPMKNNLEQSLSKHIKDQRVHFLGSLYNEADIAPLLYNADLCVSPGNVGLTCIHALSYGTPVATHDDFSNQMPEAEAIFPGKSGFLFENGSVLSLKESITDWFSKDRDREEIRKACYSEVDLHYNPNYQVSVFNEVLNQIRR